VADHRAKNAALYDLASNLPTVEFLDPAPSLLDDASNRYRMTMNGVPLYFDKHHLNKYGAMTVMSPLLEQDFVNMLRLPNISNAARAQE
jgi:hypothetical protein